MGFRDEMGWFRVFERWVGDEEVGRSWVMGILGRYGGV